MPPNFLRQVDKVLSEIASFLQSFRAETPASTSRSVRRKTAFSWGCPHVADKDITSIVVC